MTPLFPRSGPGESGSPMSAVILRCYDFPARIPGRLFVSLPGSTLPSSVRVSQLALALPEGRRGTFRAGVIVQPATRLPACSHVDVSGTSQVSRRSILCLCLGPGPRPNQRSLAYLSVSSMLPPLRGQRRLRRVSYFGAIARLQHLLPTLQEWCCHHPCKARFRLAGSPLPGRSRTLWITTKGFRSLILLFWIYPGATAMNSRRRIRYSSAGSPAYRGRGCMSGLDPYLFCSAGGGLWPN